MRLDFNRLLNKYWLLFFFLILFLFMALFKISLKELWATISVLKIWQFSVLVLVFFVIAAFSILSRKYLLYSLSAFPKTKNLIFIHFSAMATHYSTPAKLGFPLTVYLLNKFDGIPYATGTAMVLIELVVNTGICGIIALIGSFFYFTENSKTLILVFVGLISLCVLMFYLSPLLLKKTGKNNRIITFLKNIHEAFACMHLRNLIVYMFLSFFVQLLGSINLVLLGNFFSLELFLFPCLVICSSAFFWGAISMIPVGLGVRDATVLFYLKWLGITNEVGLSIVTLQRLFSTGLSFFLGIIFGMILGLKNDHQDEIIIDKV